VDRIRNILQPIDTSSLNWNGPSYNSKPVLEQSYRDDLAFYQRLFCMRASEGERDNKNEKESKHNCASNGGL